MPALGMAQETGKLIAWLKREGERVDKGEPLMEIETDKATVEIEAPASGTLNGVRAQDGDEVPVGEVIAWILEPGESAPPEPGDLKRKEAPREEPKEAPTLNASPLARKIAAEHDLDLALVRSDGGRIEKDDVLAYLEDLKIRRNTPRLAPASPKARRLAEERGLDVAHLSGRGPEGAVLAEDVLAASLEGGTTSSFTVSGIWQVMVGRVSQSWADAPHFYLLREVDASRLVAWRERLQPGSDPKITFSDLLVKLAAAALRQHPGVNASWNEGEILLKSEINVALAIAVEAGLVAPVIHRADELRLHKIAERRQELIQRAQGGKLRPEDLKGGTFTISNLGMYGVDAFNAIVNPPQAAILATGRIAERVIAIGGRPAVRPTMMISLSCDHRVVDGARAAQFLKTLIDLIEEPLALLN